MNTIQNKEYSLIDYVDYTLVRNVFVKWEFYVLNVTYEQQRIILALEARLSVLHIKNGIKFWKHYLNQKKLAKKGCLITSNRIHQVIYFLKKNSLSFISNHLHLELVDSLTSLLATIHHRLKKELIHLNINSNSNTNLSDTHCILYKCKNLISFQTSIGLCGLVDFINSFFNTSTGSFNFNHVTLAFSHFSDRYKNPVSFLTILQYMYSIRYPNMYFNVSKYTALSMIYIPWPIHFGSLWSRHQSINYVFYIAFLKKAIYIWIYFKESRKRNKQDCIKCILWKWNRIKNRRNQIRRCQYYSFKILNNLQNTKMILYCWNTWIYSFHHSRQINYLLAYAIQVINSLRKNRVIALWGHYHYINKISRIQYKQIVFERNYQYGLKLWIDYVAHTKKKKIEFNTIRCNHSHFLLKMTFHQLIMCWRTKVEYKAVLILSRYINCYRCVRTWKYYIQGREFQKKKLFRIKSPTHT